MDKELQIKNYEQLDYDKRVKFLIKLENVFNLVKKLFLILLLSLIFGLLFSAVAKANSFDNFIVPNVKLTQMGATIYHGESDIFNNKSLINNNKNDNLNNFDVNSDYTHNNYIPPKYDAYKKESLNQKIPIIDEKTGNINQVDFSIRNNIYSAQTSNYGTTQTTFTFIANVNVNGIPKDSLRYRWDFENDGNIDSYFSIYNNVSHRFKSPGTYEVKLEVLDQKGRISTKTHKVVIVQNESPKAIFQVDKIRAPKNSIFKFDTSLSSDDQYSKYDLYYRFDFDGDGEFDTTFQNKNIWNHAYSEVGKYKVRMEVRDREGLSDLAEIGIEILDDNKPIAIMNIETLNDQQFKFDAGESFDDYTEKRNLKYRWDVNYGGVNDIIFDSSWSYSPYFTVNYKLGGTKKVRLQVMDEQGFIGESFAQIGVPMSNTLLNLAYKVVVK